MLASLKRSWFRLLCPVLFLAVSAAPALCGDPTIDAPATVKVYSLVTVSSSTPAVSYHWLIVGKTATPFRSVTADGSEIVWTGPPGTYLVTLVVVNSNGTQDTNNTRVVISDDPNPPEPDPIPPEPDPPVPPVDPKWQIAFFHNSNDLDNYTQEQLAMLQGLKFRKALVEEGHNFIGSYDVQSPTKDRQATTLAQWFAAVKGSKTPVVALAPKDGGTIQVFSLTTKSALTTLLKTTRQETK
jgi:hypothetical protein